MVSEAMQEKQVAKIAEEIAARYDNGVRIVLIPSLTSPILILPKPMRESMKLLVVHVYVNGYDVAAIGHDGVDATVAQGEDAVHNILFHFLHFAVLSPFVYHGFDFLFSHFFFSCVDMQQVEDK